MPVYEYQCTQCGEIKEAFQKISDAPLTECSNCRGQLKKLISQSTFHLKGSGWYVTDYGGTKAPKNDSGSTGTDSKAAESKTASAEKTD